MGKGDEWNMQTEEDFIKKVSELMDTSKVEAIEKARQIYHSGCIDPEDFENDYILPKCFMVAFGKEMVSMWSPLSAGKKIRAIIRNIERF